MIVGYCFFDYNPCMPRPLRNAKGDVVYHVLNRGNGRARIFRTARDYEAFEEILVAAQERAAMRITAYCIMPNHWHLVLWPRKDGDLSEFMRWLTVTHTQRWHAAHGTAGSGHVYQGRFKSFPVQSDEHYLTVCRYVERNALQASLVRRAQQWRWSSLWHRLAKESGMKSHLTSGPLPFPEPWDRLVNQKLTEKEVEGLRKCLKRSSPFGHKPWITRIANTLGLTSTLRPRGRPRKTNAKKGS